MTGILPVSSDWLALRESEDARARSVGLARAAAALLGRGSVRIHDLGSGTGSMMRWLAPQLPGPQRWVLHDWNPELVARALDDDRPRDLEGRPVDVTADVDRLSGFRAADLDGASLVTASALLDVLTIDDLRAIVDACVSSRTPALFALTVTGRVELQPSDPRDAPVERAFNQHQQRSVDGRRLLGPTAGPVTRRLFQDAGWRVRETDTLWKLDPREADLLTEWLRGWLEAAFEQTPSLSADHAFLRAFQAETGQLSAVVHHTDLLAWPT